MRTSDTASPPIAVARELTDAEKQTLREQFSDALVRSQETYDTSIRTLAAARVVVMAALPSISERLALPVDQGETHPQIREAPEADLLGDRAGALVARLVVGEDAPEPGIDEGAARIVSFFGQELRAEPRLDPGHAVGECPPCDRLKPFSGTAAVTVGQVLGEEGGGVLLLVRLGGGDAHARRLSALASATSRELTQARCETCNRRKGATI